MKKVLFSCFVLLFAFTCSAQSFPEGVSVSERGFLKFENSRVVAKYIDYLANSTHAEVQERLQALNFSSLGRQKYEASAERIKEDEQLDYVLTTSSLVEVERVLIRPIEENNFLLAINTENLNDETYEKIVNSEYDKSSMNKFAVYPEKELGLPLIKFMQTTPAGFEQSGNSQTAGQRIRFGIRETTQSSEPTYGNTPAGCTKSVTTCAVKTLYIFVEITSWIDESSCTTSNTTVESGYCNPHTPHH